MTQRMDAMALKHQMRINQIVNIEIDLYKVLNNNGLKKKHYILMHTERN